MNFHNHHSISLSLYIPLYITLQKKQGHWYNRPLFTDTNSVICKMSVGTGKASLVQREVARRSRDGGIVRYRQRQSPSQKSKISASPLYTRGPYQPQKRRKIYESNWGAMGAPPVAGGATRASGRGRQLRKAFESRRRCRAPQQGLSEELMTSGVLSFPKKSAEPLKSVRATPY